MYTFFPNPIQVAHPSEPIVPIATGFLIVQAQPCSGRVLDCWLEAVLLLSAAEEQGKGSKTKEKSQKEKTMRPILGCVAWKLEPKTT